METRAPSSPERSSSSENSAFRSAEANYSGHGVANGGGNSLHNFSSSPYRVACMYFQQGYCAYGDCCRYDHIEPLKWEETVTADLIANPSLAAASSLSFFGPLREMNPGETERRHANFPASGARPKDRGKATGFLPRQPHFGRTAPASTLAATQGSAPKEPTKQLCSYAAKGHCRYREHCVYLHGDLCDVCGLHFLHPVDTAQRAQHIRSCIAALEKDTELFLAERHSKDLACAICMEVVYEKAKAGERRFGILSSCNHTYCLQCIRKWRAAAQFETEIRKACPQCRITSHFIIPSKYWVEEKEEKQKLIQKYKEAMSNKPCRYFDEGRGSCRFGENCFYKHAYPDGHREGPQSQEGGTWSGYGYCAQRGSHVRELAKRRENSSPFDNEDDGEEEEAFTSELGEMAAGADDKLTDPEDQRYLLE